MPTHQHPDPQETALFEPLKARAEAHWREFQPKYVRALEVAGKLDEALTQATCRAIVIMQEAMDQGMSRDQAEELGLPEILLPAERDELHLGHRPSSSDNTRYLLESMAKAPASDQERALAEAIRAMRKELEQ